MEKSYDAVGQGAAALNRKIIDIAQRNLNSGFDLAKSLAGAKNLAEMVELQAAYRRRRGDLGEPEIRRTAMQLARFGRSLPSGAISESSPSSGSSAAKTTRKGAPLHGAIGEDKTATSAATAQLLPGSLACKSDTVKRKTKNAPATSNNAVTAAANWRARNNSAPSPPWSQLSVLRKLWLNLGVPSWAARPCRNPHWGRSSHACMRASFANNYPGRKLPLQP